MATNQKSEPKYANEFLDLIEKATGAEKDTLMKKYGAYPPLNFLLSMNYNHKVVLSLPEGMPPYNRDEVTHNDLFSPLGGQIRRMLACLVTAPGNKIRKEMVFLQVLEAISPKEADILVACKDHSLTELYPSLTQEYVKSIFPGYVSE